MKKSIYSAIAIAMASTFMLFAQDTAVQPGPRNQAQMVSHHVARLTTLLNLTTAQQTQATSIFTEQHAAMSGLFSNMKAARSALETAIENNDASSISSQAAQIGSLTTQEIESHAKAEAAFWALLTPDQQAKYKQLRSMHHGGPGGFAGPGPGHPEAH
jgi:Spy/CpxP family protein refolding chaperone